MTDLSGRIADILARAILERRLAPGSKLGERPLAEILGVSRIVVRQALIRLVDDGLVTVERNRGAFVMRPNLQDALETYEAMTLIERGVAAELGERVGAAGWSMLRGHVERQHEAIAAGDLRLADDLGEEFHVMLVALGRNAVVRDIHAGLVRRVALFRTLSPADFDYCLLAEDHGRIVDLLEQGRLAQALRLIAAHHQRVVRGYMTEVPEPPALALDEALAPYLTEGPAAKAGIGARGEPALDASRNQANQGA